VSKPGQVQETRQEGEFFGEEALAIDEDSYTEQQKKKMKAYSARAVTYCDLYQLAKDDFEEALDCADEKTQASVTRSLAKMKSRLFQNPYWLAIKQLRDKPYELKKVLSTLPQDGETPKGGSARRASRVDMAIAKLAEQEVGGEMSHDKDAGVDAGGRPIGHESTSAMPKEDDEKSYGNQPAKESLTRLPNAIEHRTQHVVKEACHRFSDAGGMEPQMLGSIHSLKNEVNKRRKSMASLDLAVNIGTVENAITQQTEAFKGHRESGHHRLHGHHKKRLSHNYGHHRHQGHHHKKHHADTHTIEAQMDKLQLEVCVQA
jgi:hypothetical protein